MLIFFWEMYFNKVCNYFRLEVDKVSHVLVGEVSPRSDRGTFRKSLEVGHGAVDRAGVHSLPGRVRGLGAVPVDDLVFVLTRRFPPLSVQQEEVDDLFGVVAVEGK